MFTLIFALGALNGCALRYILFNLIYIKPAMDDSMKKCHIFHQLAFCFSLALIGVSAHAADVIGSADAGRGKVWLCIGCHSIPDYRADYPLTYRVPMLGGQNSVYIATALSEYKKGDRKHPTMRSVAAGLSDQDMADIGQYYAAQTASSPNNPLK